MKTEPRPVSALMGEPRRTDSLHEFLRSLKVNFLAGRFRIVRFVARGGMGEVYEAEDTELSERVALKTIRFEFAEEDRSAERFKREIQLARKVTHLNVCRTFDVFRHIDTHADGRTTETMFVSMELLVGETLRDRIRRGWKNDGEQKRFRWWSRWQPVLTPRIAWASSTGTSRAAT